MIHDHEIKSIKEEIMKIKEVLRKELKVDVDEYFYLNGDNLVKRN